MKEEWCSLVLVTRTRAMGLKLVLQSQTLKRWQQCRREAAAA